MEVGAGPGLLFDTMATVFNSMSDGCLWGALFFLFMVFAAISTVLALTTALGYSVFTFRPFAEGTAWK